LGASNDVLTVYTPGQIPNVWKNGQAKQIKAGTDFVIQMHYTASGKPTKDQTSIGLVYATQEPTERIVTTAAVNNRFTIPPGDGNYKAESTVPVVNPMTMLSLFPHMHLRGKSFRYEVDYPDGASEILLDVPRYDFNWQNKYVLAEPKYLPRGSLLRCTAHYDNSENNPHNPDPDATVRAGPQSWDEMFNGYFDFALADEDRTQLPSPMALDRAVARRVWTLLGMLVVLLLSAGLLLVDRLRRGPNFSLRKRLRNRHF
jgi:hypothetical protein